MPTDGPQPATSVRPCSSSTSYTAPSRAPAPIVATPSETETESIGETSTTIPLVEERPAKQCPPLRAATWMPYRPANQIASATSAGVRHRITACGSTPWNRAICGVRASS